MSDDRWEHPDLGVSEDPRYSDSTWPPGELIVLFVIVVIVAVVLTR